MFETQNVNTPHKSFHSFIPIFTETTNMEIYKKMYLVPVLEYTCWVILRHWVKSWKFCQVKVKVKVFMSLFLYRYFSLSCKSEKHVTERNKRLNLWSMFINLGTQLLISGNESLKMTCTRSYAWSFNFLLSREGWDCFLQPTVMSKLSKITDLPKVEKKVKKLISHLKFWKLAKWPIWKPLYIFCHREAKNMKFGQQITSFKGFHWVLHFRK